MRVMAGNDTKGRWNMDGIMKLPREVQATLSGLILFVIFSFFDWQQASIGPYTVGRNLWHGIGIITVLIAICYLAWEIGRAMHYEVKLGEVTPAMSSVGLSVALLIFTVITFFDWSDYRHWPQYVGLLLAILLTVVAAKRGKDEGVTMPKMPQNISVGKPAAAGGAAAAAAPAAPPEPPAAPAEPGEPPADDAGAAPEST
jgi:hypothetical protein